MEQVSKKKGRSGRWLVVVLFSSLVFGSLGISWLAINHPLVTSYRQSDLVPLTWCIEIVDGQTLKIEDKDKAEELVNLVGVLSPAHAGDALPDGVVADQEERITKGVLQGWVYKKRVKIDRPFEDHRAYVNIFGMDAGMKLLEEGQAVADRTPHPNLERYLGFEAEARAKRKGIWRNLPRNN